MKIAIAADLHLKGEDLDRTRLQLQAMDTASKDCELLVLCGDIFDRPSIGDEYASTGAIAEVAIEAVATSAEHGRVVMVPGNHDYAGSGAADALHVFDKMTDVEILREPEKFAYGDLRFTAVPWMWSGSLDPSLLMGIDLLFGHIRIGGALMGRTTTYDCKAGDWTISRAQLEQGCNAKHIALGDFHRRQDLTGRGGYVGALRQQNFGEEGNPQGFEIYDTDTELAEWIELNQCPTHRTVVLRPGEEIPQKGLFEKLRVRYLSIPDTDEVRELESQGVIVQHMIQQDERVQRAEIPEGAINDRRELIRLWAKTLGKDERVDRMIEVYEEVLG